MPGTYLDANYFPFDGIDFEGTDPELCVFDGSLPASASLSDIANTSTINAFMTNTFRNLTFRIKNGRYPVHVDSGGSYRDRVTTFENCIIEHLGNDEARAWQTSLGASGNPAGVWTAELGVGAGVASGCRLVLRGCRVRAPAVAVSSHTNVSYGAPAGIVIDGCDLAATTETGTAINLAPSGSGQRDWCRLTDTKLQGDVTITAGWLCVDPAYQPANHIEWSIEGSNNTPAVVRIIDFGRALRIVSADTSNASSVAVSGSAVALVMGVVQNRTGGGGLAAAVYGTLDVAGALVGPASDQQLTSLGTRLGDCSASPKTLSVSFQGGAAITVTWSSDMRAVSNTAILAQINAALGSSGVANLYGPGERYRPRIADEERSLLNAGTSALLRGAVLAYDGSHRRVRAMTATDEPYVFAGLAMEDILPGKTRRVKTAGYLYCPGL